MDTRYPAILSFHKIISRVKSAETEGEVVIKAFIFDLDGTLVETERLKAISYARAAVELCPDCTTEDEVIAGFKDVVGRPRAEVAQSLVKRFELEDAAKSRLAEFGVSSPWEVYEQIRLRIYQQILSDPQVIKDSIWPETVDLLHDVHRKGYKTGLATVSHTTEACKILNILGLASEFDFIATIDDVQHGKPDPEIYLLISRELGVPPKECLVIEDSLPGIKSALAAGMWVIAVTTPFTRDSVHAAGVLDERWIVDDHSKLASMVQNMLYERSKDE